MTEADHDFADAALEMCVRIMSLIEQNFRHRDATADQLTVCNLTGDDMRADELAFRAKTLQAASDSLNLALSCYGRLVL